MSRDFPIPPEPQWVRDEREARHRAHRDEQERRKKAYAERGNVGISPETMPKRDPALPLREQIRLDEEEA